MDTARGPKVPHILDRTHNLLSCRLQCIHLLNQCLGTSARRAGLQVEGKVGRRSSEARSVAQMGFEKKTTSSHPTSLRTQTNGGPSPSSRGLSSGSTHFVSSLWGERLRVSEVTPEKGSSSRVWAWAVGRGGDAHERRGADVACAAGD